MSAQIIDKSSALYLNTETRLGAGQDFWVKVVPKIVARLPARHSLWTVSSLLMAQLFTTSCRWRRGGGGGGHISVTVVVVAAGRKRHRMYKMYMYY